MGRESRPVSEPLGRRQHDAAGVPIVDGWSHDRHSSSSRRIDTTQVEQSPVGDQRRGRRA